MYRAGVRSASRQTLSQLRLQTLQSAPRRFASTATPANKSRSWKSSAVRWGLAIGAVYYYNTSSVFADEVAAQPRAAPPAFDPAELQTVDSMIEEKRKQLKAKAEEVKKATETASTDSGSLEKQPETQSQHTVAAVGSPEALEEEAGQEGAFNPETGEINWDCPCLGGMAHGPCGEEFKTAFSCFVYSTEEPKGMDCIDKFQGMQECFRKYPEIYSAELSDEEADEASPTPDVSAGTEAPAPEPQGDAQLLRENHNAAAAVDPPAHETEAKSQTLREEHPAETSKKSGHETHSVVERNATTGAKAPKAWEDATDANAQAEKSEEKKE